MAPNGHGYKEYGGHQYTDDTGTSDCEHGCGCWVGPYRSGGPSGLDPFGTCPKNPTDGTLLGGNADYDNVVTWRIRNLASKLDSAEQAVKAVAPGEAKLADELRSTKAELAKKDRLFVDVCRLLESYMRGKP